MAIFVNNQTPQNENNVGQFGASTETIGAYKQAAEYAADAEYWAKLSEQNITSVEELLVLVEELYRKGDLQQRDIEKLKADFQAQDARLMQLVSQANTAADNANNAVAIINQKIIEIQAQLDIIAAIHVTVTTLPPGTPASGNYNNATGELSLGLPQGAPGKDGSVTDLGTTTLAVPDSDDFGFFVDKDNNKVYKSLMSDIAKTFPAVTSISVNGGAKRTGDVTISKTDLGVNNVLNVPSYSKTESDTLSKGYVKSYLTKALADADVVNRTVGEVVLVWSNTKYDFYTVAAGTPKTLTLNTSEKKIVTVNRKEPDSAGNIDIIIPTGNPSLYLGELLMFPYDPDRPFNQPGVLAADGKLYDRSAYTELVASLVRGDLPCVSEAEWQAGKRSYYSWGPGGTSTTGTQFRVPDWASGTAIRTPDATADSSYDGNVFDQIPYVATINGVAPDDTGNVVLSSGEPSPFPDVWAPLSDDLRLLAGVSPYDKITVGGANIELPSKSMSFTRASTATYIDKSGILQTAAINEPRFEKKGLLVESDATNYYWNANDPSAWYSGAGLVKTVLQDGSTQAQTGNFKLTSDNTDISMLVDNAKISVALAVGESVTVSCRVKGTGSRLRVRVINGTGSFVGDATLDLENGSTTQNTGLTTVTRSDKSGDGYYNFSCYFTAATADTYYFQLRGMVRVGQTIIPSGSEISLQMPQLEKGKVKTSFIPTGAGIGTRAKDVWSLPALGNCGYRTLADKIKRTLALSITLDGHDFSGTAPISYANVVQITGPNSDIPFRLSKNASGDTYITSYRNSSLSVTKKVTPTFEDAVCVHRVDMDDVTLSFNGEFASRLNYTPQETALVASLITNNSVNSPTFVYHIRDFRVWHRALSDNQIKSLR